MKSEECFNGYLAINLCFLLSEAEVWGLFENDSLSVSEKDLLDFLECKQDLLPLTANEIIQFATMLDIFEQVDPHIIRLTEGGASWVKNKAFAVWMVGGYGEFIRKKMTFPKEGDIAEKSINGKYVAIGSQMANAAFMSDIFLEMLDRYQPKCIVDLGCGVGKRLITAAQRIEGFVGYGVDINADAVALARDNVSESELSEQVKIIEGDALVESERFNNEIGSNVDVVMSFMAMHDLFNIYGPEEAARRVVNSIGKPKYIWVADNVKAGIDEYPVKHIFTNGFEMIHALQGIDLFKLDAYIDAFQSAGTKLVEKKFLNVDNAYLMIFEVE